MDRLVSMEVFTRVVEAGSFTAAAERLRMTRAAVSKRIIQLEGQLGVRLLNRTTRRVVPTEIGRAYYERCKRVLAEASAADDLARRLHTEPKGTLRINAPLTFGYLHLGPAIAEFAVRYPELAVDLTLDDRFVNLSSEQADVAVRIATSIAPNMIAHRIAPIRIALCGAPAYLDRRGTPRSPSDLADHNCLIYTYLSSGTEWQFRGPGGSFPTAISGSFSANNGDVLCEAAAAGLGLALLPTFMLAPYFRSGALVPLMTEYAVEPITLFIVHLPERHPSLKVRLLVEFLAARFGPEPYWDRDLPRTALATDRWTPAQ